MEELREPRVLKVANNSRPGSVAGAIAGMVRDKRYVEINAIGAAAVNQTIKAIAIAKDYLQQDGIDIHFKCGFRKITVDGEERTMMQFDVQTERLM